MKADGGVDIQLHRLFMSVLFFNLLASFTLRPLYSWRNSAWHPLWGRVRDFLFDESLKCRIKCCVQFFRWRNFRTCILKGSLWFSRGILRFSRSQWPRGLRRSKSAAARLLRLWVRIPPEAWISVVSVVCCHVEVSATSWSLVQRSPTDCGALLSVM